MGGAIDRAHLAAQTFDDDALARELLALFAGQCARLGPLAADPGAARDVRRDAAHTLRGAALGVGVRRLATCAAVLEAVLAGADDAVIAAQAAAFAAAAEEAGAEASA